MKSSPLLRMGMAAVMYLLLIWGYLSLSAPQWYAVFTAVVMGVMLLFWTSEAAEDCYASALDVSDQHRDESEARTAPDEYISLRASLSKLDALKAELVVQYAQFGRDQSVLNGKSLGHWHQNRESSGR